MEVAFSVLINEQITFSSFFFLFFFFFHVEFPGPKAGTKSGSK